MSMATPLFREITPGTQPPHLAPGYRSTVLRSPKAPLVKIPQTITEISGPRFTEARFPAIANIAICDGPEAQGERIIVAGRVLDEDGRPVPHTMIEIWQANAAGRYNHPGDTHDAPLDPGFKDPMGSG